MVKTHTAPRLTARRVGHVSESLKLERDRTETASWHLNTNCQTGRCGLLPYPMIAARYRPSYGREGFWRFRKAEFGNHLSEDSKVWHSLAAQTVAKRESYTSLTLVFICHRQEAEVRGDWWSASSALKRGFEDKEPPKIVLIFLRQQYLRYW